MRLLRLGRKRAMALRSSGRPGAVAVAAIVVVAVIAIAAAGCGASSGRGSSDGGTESTTPGEGAALKAIAVETFLADIATNVAGDRLIVESLMPMGTDPHAFELTPADAARIAGADILILNGAELEPFIEETVKSIGAKTRVIEASAGLTSRTPREGEEAHDSHEEQDAHEEPEGEAHHHHDGGDPHFWLDPILMIAYVENIRDGLSAADPANAAAYQANAAAYIESLRALDTWIAQQVAAIPADRRLLVTNHESFGYFADRYGFKIVGTIMPSVSAQAAPSAQQLTHLIGTIRDTAVPAIFLETGSDPRLAEQLAAETGVEVVADLHSHSLTGADGPAPTYIDMMKANTTAIVQALSGAPVRPVR